MKAGCTVASRCAMSCGETPNAVSLVLKNQKIEPQMDADEEDEEDEEDENA